MKNKGFTLIELIAVIVVIIILAAIALPRIGDMRSKALQAQESATAATVSMALERAITEGSIVTGMSASAAQAQLGLSSPLTGVPYVSTTLGYTVGGAFPGYSVTVTPAPIN